MQHQSHRHFARQPDKLLLATKKLKKSAHGTFDYRCSSEVYVCKWNDNSVVSVDRNYATHCSVKEVKQRVNGQSNTKIKQLYLIAMYNKGMGGIDLFDWLLGSYQSHISGKKWYWTHCS